MSFKWLNTRASRSTTPTLITEALHYLTTAVFNDCYSEVMAYTVLAYSHWASFHNVYGCLHSAH